MWLNTAEKYELLHMHAKNHANIYGNVRADKAADKGAVTTSEAREHKDVPDLGGLLRFAELYHSGDCGLDSDLERKYAGKRKALKKRKFERFEDVHMRAIQNHLRQLGCRGDKAARIIATIDEDSGLGLRGPS